MESLKFGKFSIIIPYKLIKSYDIHNINRNLDNVIDINGDIDTIDNRDIRYINLIERKICKITI